MEQPNPYAPPTAAVEDPEIPPGQSSPHVLLACRLLWASIGFSVLDGIVDFAFQATLEERQSSVIGSVTGLAIGAVIVAWHVHYLRAGRNWMRWVATILTVLGALSIAWVYTDLRALMPQPGNPLQTALVVIPQLVSLAAVALLHTPESRAWFRAKSAAR